MEDFTLLSLVEVAALIRAACEKSLSISGPSKSRENGLDRISITADEDVDLDSPRAKFSDRNANSFG